MNTFVYIQRLKAELWQAGIDSMQIEIYCDQAEYTIQREIKNTIDEVEDSCRQIERQYQNAVKLQVVETAEGLEVISMPSETVHVPEQNMLPHLLKNAKVAKDGSRYKVIPIGKKSTTSIVDAFRRGYKDAINRPPEEQKEQEFRTASSKQNGNRNWVTPARTIDISQDIDALNAYLRQRADEIIESTIDEIKQRVY